MNRTAIGAILAVVVVAGVFADLVASGIVQIKLPAQPTGNDNTDIEANMDAKTENVPETPEKQQPKIVYVGQELLKKEMAVDGEETLTQTFDSRTRLEIGFEFDNPVKLVMTSEDGRAKMTTGRTATASFKQRVDINEGEGGTYTFIITSQTPAYGTFKITKLADL